MAQLTSKEFAESRLILSRLRRVPYAVVDAIEFAIKDYDGGAVYVVIERSQLSESNRSFVAAAYEQIGWDVEFLFESPGADKITVKLS